MNCSEYIGIPWAADKAAMSGADCRGLIMLMLERELELSLDLETGISANDWIGAAGAIEAAKANGEWLKVSIADAQAFDIVLMRGSLVDGKFIENHIGMVAEPGQLIHVKIKTASVCVPFDHPSVRHKITGIYRHPAIIQALAA